MQWWLVNKQEVGQKPKFCPGLHSTFDQPCWYCNNLFWGQNLNIHQFFSITQLIYVFYSLFKKCNKGISTPGKTVQKSKPVYFNSCVCVCFLHLDSYSLSILRRTGSSDLNPVKHYRISQLENSWVYISPGLTFPSLHYLVEHYSGLCWGPRPVFSRHRSKMYLTDIGAILPSTELPDGLCCRLTVPCFIQGLDEPRPVPTTVRRPTINWREISRWEDQLMAVFAGIASECIGSVQGH